ncbi:MAG: hypothetical protein ACW99U_20960 [Candidatus Thorarchaeota archaeon]|jgi:hypothetical protein
MSKIEIGSIVDLAGREVLVIAEIADDPRVDALCIWLEEGKLRAAKIATENLKLVGEAQKLVFA